MATHSSVLAWRIPWTEEPGGGYSPRGHRQSDTTAVLTLSLSGGLTPVPGGWGWSLADVGNPRTQQPMVWLLKYIPIWEEPFSGSDYLQPCGLQHTRPPCPSPTLGAFSKQGRITFAFKGEFGVGAFENQPPPHSSMTPVPMDTSHTKAGGGDIADSCLTL